MRFYVTGSDQGSTIEQHRALLAKLQDESMTKKTTVEDLARSYAEEFFNRRCDSDDFPITDYHREALAEYFENFARAILIHDPDGVMEVDVAAFVADQ